jgi:hypothetical protein
MSTFAPPVRVRSLRHGELLAAQRAARTCYGHLAGELGVAFHDALVRCGIVRVVDELTYALDAGGETLARELSIDLAALGTRRPLVAPCLDASERRFHLGGKFACALTAAFLALGWLERTPVPRAVRMTADGAYEISRRFSIGVDGRRALAPRARA